MTGLTIELLGPWRVTRAGGAAANLKYDKVRALLAYIAVESGRAHRREHLATLLWPDLPPDAARNNTRQALHTLRQAIGDNTNTGFLVTTRTTVQFNSASKHRLDVLQFTEAVASARQHAHRNPHSCQSCAARLRQAAALYRGPFLVDLALPDSVDFEEWALLQREHLSRLALDALQHLLEFYRRRGDYDRAAGFAQRQLAIEPWREQAHRALMRLHLLRDRRAAALAQYETCRAVLRDELGVAPEEKTTRLYEEIRSAGDTSPNLLPQTDNPPFLVPLPPTPFIGRETELDEIARLLDSATARLITITGPGGVGKTRLALQAAADQANLFAGGIYFVNLLSLESASQLPGLIADIMELDLERAPSARSPDARELARALKGKEYLLILDNFDHLVAESRILEPILGLAPGVNILVTSRQRLNLQAEWVFPLSGFRLPDPHLTQDPPLADSAPLQLFLGGAARAGAHVQDTQENISQVARICRLLDGLPLGIELAAGWSSVLSLAEIAAEIERSARFLIARQRGMPQRQHSLWAVLSQSWQLLAATEQQTLAQLSVFETPFTRAAAADVAGADITLLAALVEKSLLQRHPPQRFGLHPLMRQFAAEQHGRTDAVATTRRRHFEFFLQRVQVALSAEDEQTRRMRQLAGEYDDVRAALSWAREAGESHRGLRLATTLYQFWYWRSHFREGSDWLGLFLDAAGSSLPPELHARALYAHGVLLSQQDRYEAAQTRLAESLARRRQLDDRAGQAACLNSLGILAWRRESYERATKLLQESLALRRELGDSNLGPPLNNLGLVAIAQGDFERAESYFSELLRRERELGRDMGMAISLGNLALALLEQHRLEESEAHLLEGLSLFRKLGDREGLAGCLEIAASLAVARDDAGHAVRLAAAATTLRQAIHVPLTGPERLRFEKTLAAAQSALSPQAFSEAWQEGANHPLEHHLNQILDL